MNQINFIEIITVSISFFALIISLFCYMNNRRELFINAYSKYRIEWIQNIRILLFELIECKLSDSSESKLMEIKYKIDTYLNFKYFDHKEFSDTINLLIKDEKSIDNVIEKSQILIDNYWKKAKTEAKMGKITNKLIRKITYGNNNLYD